MNNGLPASLAYTKPLYDTDITELPYHLRAYKPGVVNATEWGSWAKALAPSARGSSYNLPSYADSTGKTIADKDWFTGDAITRALRYQSQTGEGSSPERNAGLKQLAALNANRSNTTDDDSFWGNILTGFKNLAKTDPMQFINTGLGIWNAFSNYQNSKKMLGMYQDQLNLQREAYEKNEARNQERFNWLRDARATSQL